MAASFPSGAFCGFLEGPRPGNLWHKQFFWHKLCICVGCSPLTPNLPLHFPRPSTSWAPGFLTSIQSFAFLEMADSWLIRILYLAFQKHTPWPLLSRLPFSPWALSPPSTLPLSPSPPPAPSQVNVSLTKPWGPIVKFLSRSLKPLAFHFRWEGTPTSFSPWQFSSCEFLTLLISVEVHSELKLTELRAPP